MFGAKVRKPVTVTTPKVDTLKVPGGDEAVVVKMTVLTPPVVWSVVVKPPLIPLATVPVVGAIWVMGPVTLNVNIQLPLSPFVSESVPDTV